jgi:hypothetical protein
MQVTAREKLVGAERREPDALGEHWKLIYNRKSYLIAFFKYLRSSNGHEFKCVQEIVTIERAKSIDRAVEAAKRRFERRRHVVDWQLHSDGFDVKMNDC